MAVRELFAAGYALADTLPLTTTARAACTALEALTEGASLAYQVGTTEGRRDALHRRRMRTYAEQTALVVALVGAFTGDVDHRAMSTDLLDFADRLPDDMDPVEVRRQVKDRVEHELLRQALMVGGLMVAWGAVNDRAQQASAVSGAGEGLAGLAAGGGPPTVPAAKTATQTLDPTSAVWRDAVDGGAARQQLNGLAGDVGKAVLAAKGDREAAAQATRDALDALDGVEFWAEEELHLAGSIGFRIVLDGQGTPLNFVTMGDGHVDFICLELESQNPYQPMNLPMVPQHIKCRCWHEVADRSDWAQAS